VVVLVVVSVVVLETEVGGEDGVGIATTLPGTTVTDRPSKQADGQTARQTARQRAQHCKWPEKGKGSKAGRRDGSCLSAQAPKAKAQCVVASL
jgi:hypothetical protein